MTARSTPQAAEISFEVHVQRDEGWLVDDLFEDQAAALEYAERLRQRRDVGGIRVVRESYDPVRDEAFEKVVLDTGSERPKPPRWLMASFSGIRLLMATILGAARRALRHPAIRAG